MFHDRSTIVEINQIKFYILPFVQQNTAKPDIKTDFYNSAQSQYTLGMDGWALKLNNSWEPEHILKMLHH